MLTEDQITKATIIRQQFDLGYVGFYRSQHEELSIGEAIDELYALIEDCPKEARAMYRVHKAKVAAGWG